jgi:hypothetical protein
MTDEYNPESEADIEKREQWEILISNIRNENRNDRSLPRNQGAKGVVPSVSKQNQHLELSRVKLS